MFNKDLHRSHFILVLRAIYSDPEIRTLLGFKGGTAAMFFYNLPRFSVDLDFDLLDLEKKELVFEKIKSLLKGLNIAFEAQEKRYTLFYLLHYKKGDRSLKIEVPKRPGKSSYELKSYLGIPMLVMKKEDVIACKLGALLTRKNFASRDLFDLWFFLKENWTINAEVLEEKTNFSIRFALQKAITNIENIQENQLLQGLGELLEDKKQKVWVKTKLREEVLFMLRLYEDSLKRNS